MARKFDRKLVLEDGTEYLGFSFGAVCDKVCELVFNTSVVGYQELASDPAYTYQAVVMTYPLIGNYGITDEDYEARNPSIGALLAREYNENRPSNFRCTQSLSEWMEENYIPGVFGFDTRKLTRSIRDNGTCKVLITSPDTKKEEALRILNETSIPTDAVSVVSCKKIGYSKTQNARYNIVAVDCGIKLSTVRALNMRGCNVTIVPYNTSADEIIKMKPDGIFLSGGPGNPEDVPEVISLVSALKGKYPIFGVGLGFQILCLAYGAKTYKMKFGHRGANHPIKNLFDDKIDTASQNHGYAVSADSLKNTELQITHINMLDETVEGASCLKDKVAGVQFQPEGIPSRKDSYNLFDHFISIVREGKNNA